MKYNIICHDGKSFEISEEQNKNIIKLSTTDAKGINANGNFISFANIARIEKTGRTEYPTLPEAKRTYKKEQHLKNLNSLKEGFLTGVSDRNNLKVNQKTFIERIDKAIQTAINSTDKEFEFVPKKIFGY